MIAKERPAVSGVRSLLLLTFYIIARPQKPVAQARAQLLTEAQAGEARGIGLGSQLSQLVQLAQLSAIDHYAKEERRVPVYERYMECGVSKAVIMLVVLLSVQMDGAIGGKIMLHRQRGAVYSGKLRAEGQGQRCGPVGRRRK